MKLVLAIGGGGDVVSAAVLARKLGAEVGLLPWERYVVDPIPGPLTFRDFRGVKGAAPLFVVEGSSLAIRGGKTIKPQGACVAEALGRPVYAISPDAPPSEVGRALAAEFDEIIGIDVGGDVLACGCEHELHSPLADSYSLAVLKRAEEAGASVEVAVAALGADGELPREYLLKRIAELASRGALRGYYAFEPSDAPLLEALTSKCVTEASAMALRALRGEYGALPIRGGARLAYLDIFTPVIIRLSVPAVLSINKISEIIYERDWDVFKAAEGLRELGFTTEYDFERYIALGLSPKEAIERARSERRCVCAR